jgi:hypothetical protein
VSPRALRVLVSTSFVAGLVLMVGFDCPLTRVLGIASLLAFIVAGLFLIADPQFLEDGDEAAETVPATRAAGDPVVDETASGHACS